MSSTFIHPSSRGYAYGAVHSSPTSTSTSRGQQYPRRKPPSLPYCGERNSAFQSAYVNAARWLRGNNTSTWAKHRSRFRFLPAVKHASCCSLTGRRWAGDVVPAWAMMTSARLAGCRGWLSAATLALGVFFVYSSLALRLIALHGHESGSQRQSFRDPQGAARTCACVLCSARVCLYDMTSTPRPANTPRKPTMSCQVTRIATTHSRLQPALAYFHSTPLPYIH